MSKVIKFTKVGLLIFIMFISWSLLVAADGGGSLVGFIKIGVVTEVKGDVNIKHEKWKYTEYIGREESELVEKVDKQLQIGDIIYTNSLITTGVNSQLTIDLFLSDKNEEIIGKIVFYENTIMGDCYTLEKGKIKVYLNGKRNKRFVFDGMNINPENGQEVEFEIEATKKEELDDA
ncbi:MAG: hypothetical protein ACOC2J_04580 [bacterium]